MALTEIDRDLLKRCLAGDPGSWNDFVDRFLGLFVHVVNHSAHARSVRLSSEDVDDLCAEVYLALLDRNFAVLRQFRGSCSLATYLTVVARRVVVREMARRRMAEALGHVHGHAPAAEHVGADSPAIQRVDNRDEVERMLQGLPPVEAGIVSQYHLEGLSYREIASRLGVPENSIGPTLTRARNRLRGQEVTL